MPLNSLEVPHGETSFVVNVPAHGRFGYVGNIPIAYFGHIENGIFYVVSYSFSVQKFHQDVREAYGYRPQHTAMLGLKIAGVPLRNEG